jgi:ATP-binding protein involved in chromosome partitioning
LAANKCTTCEESQCTAQEKRPGERQEDFIIRQELQSRMCRIKHKILVLSGKGGVGKSTVAVNLAVALANEGKGVGLLDVDIHGPSVPKLLHIEHAPVSGSEDSLYPVELDHRAGTISVMSIGFFLRERDDAVIWRGPRKFGLIRQFLKDVEWGALDYLVIDSPPGTGDEPLAVAELIENADGAVVVTTPQDVAVQDVRRCIVFCREVDLPVLGVVENMSGFTCPKCGERLDIFGADGGQIMAEDMGVPYLGAIPIEREVVASGDQGTPIVQSHPDSETARAFGRIVRALLEAESSSGDSERPSVGASEAKPERIAVPVTNGVLSSHFGHCEQFVFFDVGPDGRSIGRRQQVTPPSYELGAFPRWLHAQGATVIIAGEMGSRSRGLFTDNDIEVVMGAGREEPDAVVRWFLDGRLKTASNARDHQE